MDTNLSELFATLLTVLIFVITFIKAVIIPVAPAAVIVSFLVDHVLKRLPFWKNGWGGYAALALNLLFSAGLFFAAQAGQGDKYMEVVGQLGVALTLVVSTVAGFVVSATTHEKAMELGVGKSLTPPYDWDA